MTQIFGVVTRKCVFHVSDRLLSRQISGAVLPFDPNSNKSIIFRATDAHVVVAYTGRAYLDHIPTDTFIAQCLLGLPLSGSGGFIGIGRPTSWTDIGRSVERLRQCLSSAFEKLPSEEQKADFQVSIMGWRQRFTRTKRITPVIWELRRPLEQPSKPFVVSRAQRWWGWDRGYTLSMIPNAESAVVEWMRHQLRQYGGNSPDEIKRVLVNGLCRCAENRPDTVGKACLQIFLTPTVSPHARVRYISNVCQPETLHANPVGFSPWIIAPPIAFAPALLKGGAENRGWTILGTEYSWIQEGPIGPKDSRKFSQSSQRRRSDPQQPK